MRASFCLFLAACAANPSGDGAGATTAYVIDGITLPRTAAEARRVGGDLDGNGTVDNVLGNLTAFLAQYQDLDEHAADMIGAGAIASTLELRVGDRGSAAAAYFGSPDASATQVGGTIAGGAFVSNQAGAATLRLPVFAEGGISTVELDAMELALAPDGNGGFEATLRGGVPPAQLQAAIVAGITAMIARAPADHYTLARSLDTNHDGVVSAAEITAPGSVVTTLTAPDVTVAGDPLVSFAFTAHVSPCDGSSCGTAVVNDPCHDGLRDGDETDVDCGGRCGACPAGAACTSAADCATAGCDSGICRAPSCTDGVRDGLETGVDCGWNCPAC